MQTSNQINEQFQQLKITANSALQGSYQAPSDKSISHRALIFGAIAQGQTVIKNLLQAADVQRTKTALQQLGVTIIEADDQTVVTGLAGFNFSRPKTTLDFGNSGTTARLFLGLLAKQNFSIQLSGDDSLSQRPMARVTQPLMQMGLQVNYLQNYDYLPLELLPNQQLNPLTYQMPIASAQLKSALILAGLQATGPSTLVQPAASRNHTELMLAQFGGMIHINGLSLTIEPLKRPLRAQTLIIPGDPSTAAFFITAALLLPNSQLTIKNHSLNQSRIGFLNLLQQLQAPIQIIRQDLANEPSGDIVVNSLTQPLASLRINRTNLGTVIDEIPIISLLATQSIGQTEIRDAGELRYKETNRLQVIESELTKFGADITALPDGLLINGPTKLQRPTEALDAHQDHRIAMMLVVAELILGEKVPIKGLESIVISNPTFFEDLSLLLKDQN